jgi:hypothetical protein
MWHFLTCLSCLIECTRRKWDRHRSHFVLLILMTALRSEPVPFALTQRTRDGVAVASAETVPPSFTRASAVAAISWP